MLLARCPRESRLWGQPVPECMWAPLLLVLLLALTPDLLAELRQAGALSALVSLCVNQGGRIRQKQATRCSLMKDLFFPFFPHYSVNKHPRGPADLCLTLGNRTQGPQCLPGETNVTPQCM